MTNTNQTSAYPSARKNAKRIEVLEEQVQALAKVVGVIFSALSETPLPEDVVKKMNDEVERIVQ